MGLISQSISFETLKGWENDRSASNIAYRYVIGYTTLSQQHLLPGTASNNKYKICFSNANLHPEVCLLEPVVAAGSLAPGPGHGLLLAAAESAHRKAAGAFFSPLSRKQQACQELFAQQEPQLSKSSHMLYSGLLQAPASVTMNITSEKLCIQRLTVNLVCSFCHTIAGPESWCIL